MRTPIRPKAESRRAQHAGHPVSWTLARAALPGLLMLAGCSVLGPDHQRPAVALPAQFAGATAAAPQLASDWWRAFGDAGLTARIERALAANADIAQAVARVEQAATLVREADSASRPGVDAAASTSRGRSTVPGATATSLRGALSTSFEIDFWGRLQRANEVARAQLLASSAAQATVQLSVAALVAQQWFALQALDEQVDAAQQVLATRERSQRVVAARLAAGTASRLELEQGETLRADAALLARELQRQRALAEAQIALLSAEPGLRIAPGRLAAVPPLPPPGLPSALLERRPDVQRAEQLLVAANAQIGIARAAMRPSLSLTGLLGQQSAELGDLLAGGSRIWSLGFGLALPLFDGGRLAARADAADARQREAVAAYQAAVASAFREVADALVNAEAARAAQPEVEGRERASAKALEMARARHAAGYSGMLELLDAERGAIAARLDGVRNRQAEFAATVELMKALGGGWSAPR